jgi:poly-gamma-glutamate capsule biosynthesis protein CapA/YwtB (metallophosphatase superfamily)
MRSRGLGGALLVAVLLGACESAVPTPRPSAGAAGPTPSPAVAPTAATTPGPNPTESAVPYPSEFPLAVVTGETNLKAWTDLAEVSRLASSGKLIPPCGVEVLAPALTITAACRPADELAADIQATPSMVALLPPGLVEPATKTLPIGGKGPYGIGGADLFGDPAARTAPYPILARATGDPPLPVEWVSYDPASVWTLASIGGICSDAGAAYQALHLGKGWDWVFDGGTARYRGKPYLNPNPPPGISAYPIVSPVDTGHHGAMARLVSGADLTIADVECPIVEDFVPNWGGKVLRFSISADVLPLWTDKLGIDVVYLAANHNSDKGVAGIRSTLRLLKRHGILGTGLGMDLDQALQPAFVDVAGVRIAFVAWNIVPGSARAGADTAGVAWLTKANVIEGVRRARAGGAQIVICDPQWWGGAEYHSDLRGGQYRQLGWFDEAGCDQVIGAGTHLAGPLLLRSDPSQAPGAAGGVGLVMASEGNVTFGQGWWQQTQEGVLMTASFRGTRLVNVHLYPYVMLANARAALTNPEGDGHYVMERVWRNSEVDYLP